MGVRMKNYIFGVHSKIRLLGGSGSVKTRGAVCRFKWGGGLRGGGGWQERGGSIFEEGI